jgi:hypothetical protein
MFRTHESVLAGIPGLFGQGYTNWHMVERLLALHWFHVCLEHREEGRALPLVMMPSDVDMLSEILTQQDATIVVTDVQVVTPAWMNKSGGWRMEKLEGLSVGYDKLDIRVSLIEVAGGKTYTDVHDETFDAKTLRNISKIY